MLYYHFAVYVVHYFTVVRNARRGITCPPWKLGCQIFFKFKFLNCLSKLTKQPFVSCFVLFALVQRAGAGGTGLPILRELSLSIFLKASASNTVRLSVKLFD